jgi:RNA polymerase sigma-B factor
MHVVFPAVQLLAGAMRPERTLLDDDEIALLHTSYAAERDRSLREALLAHYDPLAVRMARAFGTRREEPADLVQVARIGLIHAVDRFDPTRERPFPAFARATIRGELKRHIRDHTWRMRVARGLQERYLAVIQVLDDLTQELGRSPLSDEVAVRTGFSNDEVVEAMELAASIEMRSVDQAIEGESFQLSIEDPGLRRVEDDQTVRLIVALLPEWDRETLRLRFEQNLTQSDIAARMGVNQMAISRALARILHRMRTQLREP